MCVFQLGGIDQLYYLTEYSTLEMGVRSQCNRRITASTETIRDYKRVNGKTYTLWLETMDDT